jgi:5-(carboxyamino)imidazole ribonucleotide synthase
VTLPILPGATIGILGSGQLGRMLAVAARRMGYGVQIVSPEPNSPASHFADKEWVCSYDDADHIEAFAKSVDVVTFEFENVPSTCADICSQFVPVRPRREVLETSQNRRREKTFLRESGFPVTTFFGVSSAADLKMAFSKLQAQAILKTAGFGYDGKGQIRLSLSDDIESTWRLLGAKDAILEETVNFTKEISIVAARGNDGSYADFPIFENHHKNQILDLTLCPAAISPECKSEARMIARGILEQLDVVGVMCVEMFVTADDRILVNELAPRVHNSGHLTLDACVTSQFEQQIRAICGLPLGSTDLMRPSAMVNILGDIWSVGEPNWERALTHPAVKLHLYGKENARPGRKMGHLTAVAETVGEAAKIAMEARQRLTSR